MLTEERYGKILSIVDEQGSVKVTELMKYLDASESTIRRDLNVLDESGQLVKVHGGAISKGTTFNAKDDDVVFRKALNKDEKNLIARYAASLIGPEDFVYLDAGTTTELMIEYITAKSACFVTNAVTHAKRLSQMGIKVYILGGEFKAATEAIVGDEAVASLEKYNFTKGFFGTNGISVEKGFTTPDVKEAMIKRKAMANCKQCYVLGDESKFSKLSCVTFAAFDSATIITSELEQDSYHKYKNIVEVES